MHLEVMKDPPRKDGFEETHKLAQYWKPRLRITCINMELKSESWIVINRTMNEYVNELLEENWKPTHCEEVTTGTGETSEGTIHSTIIFTLNHCCADRIDQRKWKDILAVDHVDKGSLSFSVSKTKTRIPRHRDLHREADGAPLLWNTLSPLLCRECRNALRWTKREWLNHLHNGSEWKRLSAIA